jgi:hypothetical protein
MEDDRRGHVIRQNNPSGNVWAAYDLDVQSAEALLLSYLQG